MVVGSYVATVPLVLVYVLLGGVAGDVALILAGATVVSTFGVTLVMSQEYMPGRIGLASGLSVGLAIGLGGVFAVGWGASRTRSTSTDRDARDGGRARRSGRWSQLALPPARPTRLVERPATSPTEAILE